MFFVLFLLLLNNKLDCFSYDSKLCIYKTVFMILYILFVKLIKNHKKLSGFLTFHKTKQFRECFLFQSPIQPKMINQAKPHFQRMNFNRWATVLSCHYIVVHLKIQMWLLQHPCKYYFHRFFPSIKRMILATNFKCAFVVVIIAEIAQQFIKWIS